MYYVILSICKRFEHPWNVVSAEVGHPRTNLLQILEDDHG